MNGVWKFNGLLWTHRQNFMQVKFDFSINKWFYSNILRLNIRNSKKSFLYEIFFNFTESKWQEAGCSCHCFDGGIHDCERKFYFLLSPVLLQETGCNLFCLNHILTACCVFVTTRVSSLCFSLSGRTNNFFFKNQKLSFLKIIRIIKLFRDE